MFFTEVIYKTMENRRSIKRVLVDLSCAVTLTNGVKIPGVARNLSARGMFVESNYPLTKGTEITLNFNILLGGELKAIEATSQVEHRATKVSLGEYGIGVHFTEIDEESLDFLELYIQGCPSLH